MASEIKQGAHFYEMVKKERQAYMDCHGIDFYQFSQLEYDDKVDYIVEFTVTEEGNTNKRIMTMRGNVFDIFLLAQKLLNDDLTIYKTSNRTYELASVLLVDN